MNENRDRIRETSIEVTVGFFVFMMVLALGVFTIVLSRQSLTRISSLSVEFDEVMGVREGDVVYVRGVNVGKIHKISMGDHAVLINLALTRTLDIRTDYRIEILPTSVLGGRYLNVFEGTPGADRLKLDPSKPLKGLPPVDLVQLATRTVQDLRRTLVDGGVLDNIRNMVDKLNAIVNRVEKGEGTVGRLLKEEDVYNDLKVIAEDFRQVSGKIARGEGSLGKFLADDGQLYNEADKLVKSLNESADNIKHVTDNLANGRGLIGKLMSDDETVYDDIKTTASNLRELSDYVNRGEGTFGKLMKDDTLYLDIKLLINELRATLDDYRETSPISTFTSIFMGAF